MQSTPAVNFVFNGTVNITMDSLKDISQLLCNSQKQVSKKSVKSSGLNTILLKEIGQEYLPFLARK